MIHDIDKMVINFNSDAVMGLKFILAFIMFGVALDIHISDLKNILKHPKSILIGLTAQFLVLPFITFVLISIFNPLPSLALGMILVAACPGGNLSNLFTMLSKGNTALSVSMTFMATVFAIVMTPLNIQFWGSMYAPTSVLVERVALDIYDVFLTIVFILGVPLVVGMLFRAKFPDLAQKVKKSFKIFSFFFLIALILGALASNFNNFLQYIHMIFLIVLLHNIGALSSGYFSSMLAKLSYRDRRAITIEVGIQNSGLGLALALEFFHGMGGVVLVCAWWGVWHIVAGGTMVYLFARQEKKLKSGVSYGVV